MALPRYLIWRAILLKAFRDYWSFLKLSGSFYFSTFSVKLNQWISWQVLNSKQKALKLDWSVFHLAVEVNVIKAILVMIPSWMSSSNKWDTATRYDMFPYWLIVSELTAYYIHISVKSVISVSRRRVVPLLMYNSSLLCWLQVSANVNSCYETGMTDFTDLTEIWISNHILLSFTVRII